MKIFQLIKIIKLDNNGGCDHNCKFENKIICMCRDGYVLSPDDQKCWKRCGGVIEYSAAHSLEGELTSPRYPLHYPPDQHCVWDFVFPDYIFILFYYLLSTIDITRSCVEDYLTIGRTGIRLD